MLPTFKALLLATDLSETAAHAMGFALSLADAYGASLTVLHVLPDVATELSQRAGLDPASLMSEGGSMDWLNQVQQATEHSVASQVARLCETVHGSTEAPAPSQLDVMVKTGDPVDTILDTAHAGPFDLIIVGTQGHDMVSRLLVGSVAEGVMHGSRKPVLVAPCHDDECLE